MAYQGDDRYGGDRWREREQGGRYGARSSERDSARGFEGRGYRAGGPGRGGYDRDEDDRGFLDRAGDEVRSWFGDEEAQRRREEDERHWAREQRLSGHRSNDSGYGEPGERPGGGWGNQRGDSWHRDRPGERGWLGGSARDEGYPRGYGARTQYGDAAGGGAGTGDLYGYNRAPGGASGFGGSPDYGRRFEGSGRGGDIHDPHYAQWRQRQIDEIDRDYEDYRREHQSRFEQEFGDWRSRRQGQRQSLARVSEHMDVVGSDGGHVGTVDKVRGDRVILARHDPNADGIHHSIPCSWVGSVDDKVVLNRSAAEATRDWRSEDRSRALFEREDSGSDGPRNLDRSFPGTYDRTDRDEASEARDVE